MTWGLVNRCVIRDSLGLVFIRGPRCCVYPHIWNPNEGYFSNHLLLQAKISFRECKLAPDALALILTMGKGWKVWSKQTGDRGLASLLAFQLILPELEAFLRDWSFGKVCQKIADCMHATLLNQKVIVSLESAVHSANSWARGFQTVQLEHPGAKCKWKTYCLSLPKRNTSTFCLPSFPPTLRAAGNNLGTAMALRVLGLETAEPNMDEVRQAFKKRAIEVPNILGHVENGRDRPPPAHQQMKGHESKLDDIGCVFLFVRFW